MKNMKYGIYIFHVNTNTISLTSISNKLLKLVNTKAAVKQKNLLFTPQQYYDSVDYNNKNINCQQAIRNLTTYYFYLTSQQLINGNNKLWQIRWSHQQRNEKAIIL